MKRSETKAELQTSLGTLMTNVSDSQYNRSVDFGKFSYRAEAFDDFAIAQRNFETDGDSLYIPFSCSEPCIQMIFSFDGQSFFNKRAEPFRLGQSSHCINFFKRYQCTNLLDEHSRQHDVTFRLKKGFYHDLIAQHLSSCEDRIAIMIAGEQEFNTINQHLPLDSAVTGILQNILTCPFEGEMKKAFLREHLRALFHLQLFHFNPRVGGGSLQIETAMSASDRDKLQGVKEYIDQNFLNPASLESLSKDFGLNEFKLKQGFKTLFDTSPIRYLQNKRLSFALTLLRDTDKPIKEIARRIGYSYAANFTTAFARTFGNAPQHYRSAKGRI